MNLPGFWYAPRRWTQALLRWLLGLWVKVQIFPQPLRLTHDGPVCYVLARSSLTDAAMLDRLTRSEGLPMSHAPLVQGALREHLACFALHEDRSRTSARRLTRMVAAVMHDDTINVRLVAVSIFWGRAPEREVPEDSPLRGMRWLRIWAAEGWGGRSRLRKLFAIIFYRRAVVAKFAEPISLRDIVEIAKLEGLEPDRVVRRVARLLRGQFRTEREAAIGPDLSHRRTLVGSMLREPRVRAAMLAEADTKKTPLKKVERRAEAVAQEIAADYSYLVVRAGERVLGRLWNHIYEGVDVRGIERVQSLARDNTLVYVPCHRSHIDYLLLSYVIHRAGLTVPHVAAGANLNFPIVGGILRRGGAFFLRRSFKDDALYGEVFAAYVHEVLKRGFPMEYFVEGGRSRTGRMLPPKAGLISMTVQSYLREHSRPLLFIPVYIGYEKLIEGGSYTEELSGATKRKESIAGLLSTLKSLRRERYGAVGVTFAKPISLSEVLEGEGVSTMDAWLVDKGLRKRTLTELSRLIAERINGAAQLNPVAVVATTLLATPKHAADSMQLSNLVERSIRLAGTAHAGAEMFASPVSGVEAIAHCSALGYLQQKRHPLGDVVLADEKSAVALTYFRNNVLHCFVLPGLIACLIVQHGVIGRTKLARQTRALYALLASELYLPRWTGVADSLLDDVTDATDIVPPFDGFERTISKLAADGWIVDEHEARLVSAAPPGTDRAAHLELLASIIRPTLTRHALMLAMVVRSESGSLSRDAIETMCQQAAQHLAMTHVFNAPEFSDRTQFRSAFEALLQAQLVRLDSAGFVHFDPALERQADDAAFLLPADTRAAVLRAARLRAL